MIWVHRKHSLRAVIKIVYWLLVEKEDGEEVCSKDSQILSVCSDVTFILTELQIPNIFQSPFMFTWTDTNIAIVTSGEIHQD